MEWLRIERRRLRGFAFSRPSLFRAKKVPPPGAEWQPEGGCSPQNNCETIGSGRRGKKNLRRLGVPGSVVPQNRQCRRGLYAQKLLLISLNPPPKTRRSCLGKLRKTPVRLAPAVG